MIPPHPPPKMYANSCIDLIGVSIADIHYPDLVISQTCIIKQQENIPERKLNKIMKDAKNVNTNISLLQIGKSANTYGRHKKPLPRAADNNKIIAFASLSISFLYRIPD